MNKAHIRLTHSVIVKAPGLLPMYYLPAELAGELDVPVRTLYDWLKLGAPHIYGEGGNFWIDGQAFAGWITAHRNQRATREKLLDSQAYCLRCKQVVALSDPRRERVKGKLVLIKGRCPRCGARINRGGRDDRASELPAGSRAS